MPHLWPANYKLSVPDWIHPKPGHLEPGASHLVKCCPLPPTHTHTHTHPCRIFSARWYFCSDKRCFITFHQNWEITGWIGSLIFWTTYKEKVFPIKTWYIIISERHCDIKDIQTRQSCAYETWKTVWHQWPAMAGRDAFIFKKEKQCHQGPPFVCL